MQMPYEAIMPPKKIKRLKSNQKLKKTLLKQEFKKHVPLATQRVNRHQTCKRNLIYS